MRSWWLEPQNTSPWKPAAVSSSRHRDLGENPVGASKHQAKIQEAVANSEAFSKKGPRVVLKRWFSWVYAGNFHDEVWHSRLLVIISLGIQLGIYKDHRDCPFWGGPGSEFSSKPLRPVTPAESQRPEQQRGAERAEEVARAGGSQQQHRQGPGQKH